MSDDVFQRGLAVRKAVLGDEHVDNALANATIDAEFQRFITETAWGSVWSRPGIDVKTRHMITLELVAALGHHDELAMHVRATRRTGVTEADLSELFLQVAIYAGLPAANSAFAVAKRELRRLDP